VSFRAKLMLCMAPLVLALVGVGIVAGWVADVLARQPGHIWKDNYRSVLAAQRMKESVERIHQGTYLELLDTSDTPATMAEQRARFERELAVAAANITEAGETEAVNRMRARWDSLRGVLDRWQSAAAPDQRLRISLGELARAFAEVRHSADEILHINQDAMVRKGQRTEQRAAMFERILLVAVVLASVLGLLASVALTKRLLRPLAVVSAAVRRFGQGDTQARAHLRGDDDIAHLAQEFNAMADRLERYRRSSLGDLLLAQQGSQAAIDSLPDPVLMLDASGGFLGVNTAARQHLRIDPAAKGQATLADLDPGTRSVVDRLRAHVMSGHGVYHPKGFEEAIRVTTPAGESIYLPRATPIYGESHTVTAAAVVFQDITRLFRFDELKNNLVATVAHEFRTPLTSLRMAIHMCTEEAVGPLTTKQADLLFAAREDCERLQGIVDDLLNLSRIESGRIDLRRRRVEVQALVDQAVDVHRSVAESQRLTLRTEVYPGLPEAFADPDRLQLVFANLLANAIRYSPVGGEIVVRALPDAEATRLPEHEESERACIRFEIRDQGPGIPAEHQAGLFEKFFRVPGSPAGGAGLGLFIARGIVHAHGGNIGVRSQPGDGACFWFRIPAAPAAATAP
jgi:two-component system, NtrC family, sensor histidine kinase KinB